MGREEERKERCFEPTCDTEKDHVIQEGTITSGHSKLCKTLSNLVSFSTSY